MIILNMHYLKKKGKERKKKKKENIKNYFRNGLETTGADNPRLSAIYCYSTFLDLSQVPLLP
jgi:hypothetical protein